MEHPRLVTGILRVRLYEDDDAAGTLHVCREAVRRSAARDYTPAQVEAWAPNIIELSAWTERRSSRRTWVAEQDGEVIGFSDLEPDGHIDMLYVRPEHEGRKIASALLAESERAAREKGMPTLYVEASLTARRIFLHRGFDLIALKIVELGGETLINYKTEKRLDAAAAQV